MSHSVERVPKDDLTNKEEVCMNEVLQCLDSIETENLSLKDVVTKNEEQKLCKICMDDVICMVFFPCGHLISCTNCASSLKICPICRKLIEGSLKTYMS